MAERHHYGMLADGRVVDRYILRNRNGASAEIITYGGILTSLNMRAREGRLGNVVLGYDTLAEYVADDSYLGALIGRYANRIAFGRLSIDGVAYQVTCNEKEHALHGGLSGFSKKLWSAQPGPDPASLRLTVSSEDGDQGFPGRLDVEVTYSLDDSDHLGISYRAVTDKMTVINLTSHSYFNLAAKSVSIEDHEIAIAADAFTPVNRSLIPTGEIRSIDGTALDLRSCTRIGNRLRAPEEQMVVAGGFDHNFVLNGENNGDLFRAAQVYEPASGRRMDVWTSEPGIQFYSGNFLTGQPVVPGGRAHGRRTALCLETQHFPDSPNHPHFPSTVLSPGEVFLSRTEYRFSCEDN